MYVIDNESVTLMSLIEWADKVFMLNG